MHTYSNIVAPQLDHLNKEADRLSEEKPEEAAIIRKKIAELTNQWQELKQMVGSQWLFFF